MKDSILQIHRRRFGLISAVIFAIFVLMTSSCNHRMYKENYLWGYTKDYLYDVSKKDSTYYLLVRSKSEAKKREFTQESIITMKLMNDSIMTLKGSGLGSKKVKNVYLMGIFPIVFPLVVHFHHSLAVFPITTSELDSLQNGVSELEVTMEPTNHQHKFKNAKFGNALYKRYQKLKDKTTQK